MKNNALFTILNMISMFVVTRISDLNNGLVAYYPFDGNTVDLTAGCQRYLVVNDSFEEGEMK